MNESDIAFWVAILASQIYYANDKSIQGGIWMVVAIIFMILGQ